MLTADCTLLHKQDNLEEEGKKNGRVREPESLVSAKFSQAWYVFKNTPSVFAVAVNAQ